MKFDLLGAMNTLKNELGNKSEITIFNDNDGVIMRLSVFHDDQFISSSFKVDLDGNRFTMNAKFMNHMELLKQSISS